jgi:hypothetical protein
MATMLAVDFIFNKSKVGGIFVSFSQQQHDNNNNSNTRFIGLRKPCNLKVDLELC